MRLQWAIVGVLFLIIVAGVVVLVMVPMPAPKTSTMANPATTTTTATGTETASSSLPSNTMSDTIVVTSPGGNATVQSPLILSGTARGSWYFEATAPAKLVNAANVVIAQGPITAQGDWMTNDFVPFSGSLTFLPQPAGSTGTLVLMNDNPSGDPANQKELDIPVKF